MRAATYFVGELMDEMNNELFSCEFTIHAGICTVGSSRQPDHANQHLHAAEIDFESFEGMVYRDSRHRAQIRFTFAASAKLRKPSWVLTLHQKFSNPL
ncbi:MAG: hypothetical protein ABR572_04390 [Cryomorphaceae bacterium]